MSDGPIPAVVTPFRPNELIDFTAWQTILEALAASGISGLLVAGREGEVDALSEEERVVAMRFCRQTLPDRLTLFANVGSPCTREAVRLAEAAESEGVDCAVVLLPSRDDISDQEIAEHLIDICHAVRIPVYAYERLAAAAASLVRAACDNFAGVLSSERAAVANVVTREAPHSLVEALEDAFRLHTYPVMLKEALNLAGFPAGQCRRPLAPVPEASREALKQTIRSLRDYLLPHASTWMVTKTRAGAA